MHGQFQFRLQIARIKLVGRGKTVEVVEVCKLNRVFSLKIPRWAWVSIRGESWSGLELEMNLEGDVGCGGEFVGPVELGTSAQR